MLGPGRYLLGAAELLVLVGFAWLGAARVRGRVVPSFRGAPAHLATAVLATALLLWSAELLGTVSLFEPVPYLVVVVAVGLGLRAGIGPVSPAGGARVGDPRGAEDAKHPSTVGVTRVTGPADPPTPVATAIGLAIAAIAVLRFALETKTKLGTGMTGFDTTWYHGPFAAGFFQSGDTWSLHFIAPQFLAWFYPANAEVFHAAGMLAFGRDLLSPLLNFGWFVGCLAACWCIGRPFRVAPWSLALGAVALSLPVLSDQAGEMRNDIVGIFFLLAAIALALDAWASGSKEEEQQGAGGEAGAGGDALSLGALAVVGLAAGLAAGTKLNFLLPAAVLVVGLALLAPAARRWRSLLVAGLAALAGGGYWYLRNLAHSGNPLPWFDNLGPISLPAPDQALGGREAHAVLGYLTDGAVWSDWFGPGLRDALTVFWPLFALAALAGLALSLPAASRPSRGSFFASAENKEPRDGSGVDRVAALAGLVGLAAALAWLVAPTSASGPEGVPRGFESGLRYLAPALVLGLALLPTVPPLRSRFARLGGAKTPFSPAPKTKLRFSPDSGEKRSLGRALGQTGALVLAGVVVVAVAVGYPVQRYYLDHRYAEPTFAAPGLNAAFEWARDLDQARIATSSTRQYPLFGTDLSNHVQFVGESQPHGGFTAPATCPRYRELLNQGGYDHVVTTRDRLEPGQPPYPPTTAWTEGPNAEPRPQDPPNGDLPPHGRPGPLNLPRLATPVGGGWAPDR
ncbi:MAG: hypothetical protein R2725_10110 [Solirubrobacterales bacterium]